MKVTDKITITNEDNMLLMARYPDNYFDLAIVDPPYGINVSKKGNVGGGKLAKVKNYGKKDWDNSIPTKQYFKELQRVSKNQIIWGGIYMIEYLQNTPCFLIWDKNNTGNFADAELAWTSFLSSTRIFKYTWNGMLQEKMGNNKEIRIHPTQKPADLYKWILDKYAKEGDKILDTHLGSGSIAIACHDYKYELTACELDKEYYDKAIQRITNHTNQQKLF
ncbi:MAG: site-specific DNA-methyltransferase [Dehalococcoidia bacterium]|nr:MAG: site-specific DNA-methyltransferase [Dehalococcoidia bacterium]